jgi:hypothetical protein
VRKLCLFLGGRGRVICFHQPSGDGELRAKQRGAKTGKMAKKNDKKGSSMARASQTNLLCCLSRVLHSNDERVKTRQGKGQYVRVPPGLSLWPVAAPSVDMGEDDGNTRHIERPRYEGKQYATWAKTVWAEDASGISAVYTQLVKKQRKAQSLVPNWAAADLNADDLAGSAVPRTTGTDGMNRTMAHSTNGSSPSFLSPTGGGRSMVQFYPILFYGGGEGGAGGEGGTSGEGGKGREGGGEGTEECGGTTADTGGMTAIHEHIHELLSRQRSAMRRREDTLTLMDHLSRREGPVGAALEGERDVESIAADIARILIERARCAAGKTGGTGGADGGKGGGGGGGGGGVFGGGSGGGGGTRGGRGEGGTQVWPLENGLRRFVDC